MNIKFSQVLKLTLALLLFLHLGKLSAQNNLNIRGYRSYNVGGYCVDVTVLDQVFGTVTLDGNSRTADTNLVNLIPTLPTSVSGFAGVQVVFINERFSVNNSTSAQADALIAYVKGGAVLMANLEGTLVTPTNVAALIYIGEDLVCNSVSISVAPANSPGFNLAPAFHPASSAIAPAGTYYACYYDANTDCYSPRSVAITVTATPCYTTSS